MKELLNRLINYESIDSREAREVLVRISNGEFNQSQIASFLTVYMMRNITLEELKGFREALLELCIPIDLSEFGAIDLCGTGGDGKDTFNISTLSSFVTAGAGVKVAKHGNYGVSSACGSSNVLEHLGVAFSSDEDHLKHSIDTSGICILHAPLFHPAMKNVAPIRKELGVKTFFNMLGPMVNPAFPKHQMVGVFNLELLRLYGYLYQETDMNYAIVHALDGYDEISLTGDTKVISNRTEQIFSPEEIKLKAVEKTQIFGGGSVGEAANIFMNVIEGKGTEAQNDVVCANAGLAIATARQTTHLDGIEQARESLLTGKAAQALKTLIDLSS